MSGTQSTLCKQKKKSRDSKKYLNYAPFNVRKPRGEFLGLHPGLDPSGQYKKPWKLGPGSYDIKYPSCNIKSDNKSPWSRKVQLEEFSRELGYLFPQVLLERRVRKSLGGPGTNDVNEELFRRQSSNVKENKSFGDEKRFKEPFKNNNPPPNIYIKHKSCLKRWLSSLPTLEWDGFLDRFKTKTTPWNQPPNLYDPKYPNSLNALLTKVVSKRGPYDLFTGPRDYTTIKNHFTPKTDTEPEEWFQDIPTRLDLLLNHQNYSRTGKFFKCERFPKIPVTRMALIDIGLCYKDPNAPAPNHYDVDYGFKVAERSKYAFNSSCIEARKGIKMTTMPAPGRYNIIYPTCGKKKKESYVFKSKTKREAFKTITYNTF